MRLPTSHSLLLLLSVTLFFSACDFLETPADEQPPSFPWTGNWQVAGDIIQAPDGAMTYLHLSSTQYVLVGTFEGECIVESTPITDISDVQPEGDSVSEVLDLEGDIVTISSGADAATARFQVADLLGTSDDVFFLTVITPGNPQESPGDQITGERIDFDPRDLSVCEDANVVSGSTLTSPFGAE